MNHLEGICVEYIQSLETVQDRVRELRNSLKDGAPTSAEVGEQIQQIEAASHVAWHLQRALVASYNAAVQAARKRGEES
jgi:hypothetical protein